MISVHHTHRRTILLIDDKKGTLGELTVCGALDAALICESGARSGVDHVVTWMDDKDGKRFTFAAKPGELVRISKALREQAFAASRVDEGDAA